MIIISCPRVYRIFLLYRLRGDGMNFNDLVDIKENTIVSINYYLLDILLKDRTTGNNIIWATDNYISRGDSYSRKSEITIPLITGYNGNIIKPRTKKSKQEQDIRIRKKAEVFTPAWMCNEQNNFIDESWFGSKNVFNKVKDKSWETVKTKIKFNNGMNWKDYVKAKRMEISCGEAPYLVSRYDTTTGEVIPVIERIGLLDRKMRIINENVSDENEWFFWCTEAYKNIYGFEWQGDSLLIARENLLYTFTDNYYYKFTKKPTLEMVTNIAEIISWNIFQMDGTKYVIPESCKNNVEIRYTLFGDETIETKCPGCIKNNNNLHNGIYVKVMNWDTGRKIKFVSILKKRRNNNE